MKAPKGKPRELAPEGTHNAILVQIIDLGTQPSGNPKFKDSRRLQLAFELVGPGLKTEDGSPFVQYRQYTFSSHAKSQLAKDFKAWLSVKDMSDYDVDAALGKQALVTIEHKEIESGTFANVSNISAVPKGSKMFKATEPLKSFYLDPKEFDEAAFKELPEFLQTKIAGTEEYAECIAATTKKKPTKKAAEPAGKGKKK